mgnify:CR=1 FL=1
MKEQYIRQVEKELNLSRKAKTEVVRDLNEIFNSAVEHGETEQQVIERLGTPQEFANSTAEQFGIDNSVPKKRKWIISSVISLVVAIVAFLIYKDLEESFTYSKQNVIESFKTVLSHKTALKTMIVLGISFGGFFVIIAKTSFIYIEYFKIQTDYFPLFFGVNFIILMLMIKVNVNLLKVYHPSELVRMAILIQIISAGLLTLNYENISLVLTVILIASYMSMMAFIFGNCMALTLEYFPKNAGVASGVVGVLQFGLGAAISSIALIFHDGTFFPIGFAICVISIIAFLIMLNYNKE